MSWKWTILCLLSLALSLSSCGDSWIESYDPDEVEPYGTSLLPAILQARYPDAQYQNLPRNWASEGLPEADSILYVAVGNGLLYTFSEAEALADFIKEGGEAFLATKEVSNRFLKHMFADSCLNYKELLPFTMLDTLEQVLSATGDTFLLPVIKKERGVLGEGNFIQAEHAECLAGAEHLLLIRKDTSASLYHRDYADNLPIMTRIAFGEGHLTLLSYPMLLTNVFATDSLGRGGMEEVLKLLPRSIDQVVFDYSRRSAEMVVVRDNIPKNTEGHDGNNILKHVLARPPLAAAWYLLVLGAIVFLIFGAKRRQRLIPLVQPRRNTTHEHLGNISRLYLSQPNNSLMASKQIALFEAYCNRRFGLRPLSNEADYERFCKMSGVEAIHMETLKRYQATVTRNQPISNTGFVSIVRILQAIYTGIGRRFD